MTSTASAEVLFNFTGGTPAVSVGDQARITGSVSEFTPGGTATGNLSGTQIAFPATARMVSSGNPLPEPVLLGLSGRPLRSENIDDDAFASFDSATDGIDYFESLESMRVTAPAALAVAPTNRFGEIFSVVDNGAGATGLSLRGSLNISPADFNPEKVQIDADSGILPGFEFPAVGVGAMLGNVTGVVSYDFGNFQIHPTEPFSAVAQGLVPETAELLAAEGELTVASYNVLNLDPVVEQLANVNRQDPDEIDDDAGLVPAFINAGGNAVSPVGGQPGGNIRVAFLYNPARVSLVEGLPENERYSFIFQGNSQTLDHILVSDNLADGARFDIVHVNSEFAELPERASDHDPLLAALAFAARQGDLDGDGDIDRADFRAFVKALGSREGRRRFNAEADFNGNGRVDFRDLFTFLHLLAEELRGRR